MVLQEVLQCDVLVKRGEEGWQGSPFLGFTKYDRNQEIRNYYPIWFSNCNITLTRVNNRQFYIKVTNLVSPTKTGTLGEQVVMLHNALLCLLIKWLYHSL